MRIVHVAWDVAAITGGGERAVLSLVEAIRLVQECDLVVVTRTPERTVISGQAVRSVPLWFGRSANPLPHMRQLRTILAEADVIHVHSAHTMLLDLAQWWKQDRQRLVVTDHGGGGFSASRILKRWGRVDRVVVSSGVGESMAVGPKDRISVIPLPVDTNKFQILEGVTPRAGKVLAVGRVLPHKGFDLLIEALPIDCDLTIVGKVYDNPYLRYLQHLGRGKSIEFRTDADDDAVVRELNECAVFVAPSVYRDYRGRCHPKAELFGLASVEAAACGRIVVVSDVVPALLFAINTGEVRGSTYRWDDKLRLQGLLEGWSVGEICAANRRYVERQFAPIEIGKRHVALYETLFDPGV